MDVAPARSMTKRQTILFFLSTALIVSVALAAWLYLPHNLMRLGLFGVVGCVAGLLVFAFPKHGFYFGLFYVYAGLSYYTNLPVATAVTFLVTAAAALRLVQGDSIQVRDPLFLWSLAVFTVFVFQSFFFAYDYERAFESLDFFAKSVLLVFLAGQLIRTEKDLDGLALVLFAATLSSVILGAVNIKFGIVNEDSPSVVVLGWQRFSATHLNVNRAALYLIAGLPLGIYAVKRFRPVIVKALLVVGVITVILAIIATFSRQTIFPLVVVLLAVLFREARSKWIYAVVGLAVLVGVLLIPDYYWHRVSTISDMFDEYAEDHSLAMRLKAFKAAWHMFLQHPFTGVGLANFSARSADVLFTRIGAHNGYLEILTGVGLFGFIAFMLIPIAGIRGYVTAIKTRWSNEHGWMNDVSYYFLLSAVSVLIAIFFQHTHFYRVVWLPVAVGLIAGRLAGETRSRPEKSET